ncbi:MAG TPA: zf-HC2 domain-containing protein, partial [Ktedonobacterales bacterium]|nr:zf-HC2 domain-containing protein [Ktedonobacterales bacterium]
YAGGDAMTTANASCSLGISHATIAAWRDGALPSDESARIAAHVSGCEACRHEIALYESLDNALRRQPVPQSDGRLWRAVRAGMTSAHGPRNTRRTVRRVAGATSALAAVLLLALGFAQLFQARGNITYHPSSTATVVQGTPTPLPTVGPVSPAVPGTPLTVTPANLPTSGITFGERSDDILSFGVASTDGNIAYACYSQTSNTGGHVSSQITIYRTSDRAMHWTRLAQFPWPDAQTSECVVQVDALDSSRVLVHIGGQDVTTFNEVQWYELTEDSGATWIRLAYSDSLSYLATANRRTYAIRWQVIRQQSNGQPKYEVHLSVSTDHLRTWQPIDVPITSAGGAVSQFWVRSDGTILAMVSSSAGMLQQSTDGGARWKAIPLPTLSAGLGFGSIGVQQSTTRSQPWRICIDELTTDGPAAKRSDVGVICTFDGGVTWSIRPTLCTNAPCSTRAIRYLTGFAIAPDGALLAGSPDSSYHDGLYRLPENSSQWEYLGPVSGGFFAPTSSAGGVVWSFAGGAYIDNLSGNIGGHLGSLPNVLLATAAYP